MMKPPDSTSRRSFLKASALAAVSAAVTTARGNTNPVETAALPRVRVANPPEWRNRQMGMAYRRMGATGMMVSELVMGGIPIKRDNRSMIHLAMDLGINYIDTASGYGKDGESEKALGAFFRENPGARDRLFLASKLSAFGGFRTQMYRDLYEGLPSEKKNAIQKRAAGIVEERAVGKPGVFFTYFPGQERELDWEYRIIAMQKDYGHRIDGNGKFRVRMSEILDESLQRTGVDHYDVLFCPHGCASPEQLEEPEMLETLEEMKKQGKCRFVAVSTHTAFEQVTRKAVDLGTYDLVMACYNVINHGTMEASIAHAAQHGVGFVAMKAAASVRTHFDQFKPLPAWREEKLQRLVPGEDSAPVKAYLFVLQNPNVSAVISNMWNEDMIRENVAAVGRKVDLQPG